MPGIQSAKGFSALVPLVAILVWFGLDPFDPAEFPFHELSPTLVSAPVGRDDIRSGAEFVGAGRLTAPEDILYEPKSGHLYSGCEDGWIKRVTVNDTVENWVHTGGRPLGLASGLDGEIIVADAYQGLLKIRKNGSTTEVLTREADGLRLKSTDGVDVAADGVIYFTEATYKYHIKDFTLDLLEGKPHGRLLKYDPETKQTRVLLDNLYFANGVAVSPDQSYLIFCETPMRRCRKYYIAGEKKGRVEKFVETLPGMPDNIRYDGHGSYWIAISTGVDVPMRLAFRYPFLRKMLGALARYNLMPRLGMNGGALQVDLEGKPISHYYDPKLFLITTGVSIGDYLYLGSFQYPHIVRVKLDISPATSPP